MSDNSIKAILAKAKQLGDETETIWGGHLKLEETIKSINNQIEEERKFKEEAEEENDTGSTKCIEEKIRKLISLREELQKTLQKKVKLEQLKREEFVVETPAAYKSASQEIPATKFRFDIDTPNYSSTPLSRPKNVGGNIPRKINASAGGSNTTQSGGEEDYNAQDNSAIMVEERAKFVMNIKDVACIVPMFDGDSSQLRHFIECCQEALDMMPVYEGRERTLVRMLRGRLEGEARKTIYGTKFDSLKDFIGHLKMIFGTRDDEFELEGLLAKMYQKEEESVIHFANRVREITRRLLEVHAQEQGEDQVDHQFKTVTDKRAARCFIKGLNKEISIRMVQKNTLREAVEAALDFEKEHEEQSILRGEKGREADTFKIMMIREGLRKEIVCQICDKPNHSARDCHEFYKREKYRDNQGHWSTFNKSYNAQNNRQRLLTCFYCDQPGHIVRECDKKRRDIYERRDSWEPRNYITEGREDFNFKNNHQYNNKNYNNQEEQEFDEKSSDNFCEENITRFNDNTSFCNQGQGQDYKERFKDNSGEEVTEVTGVGRLTSNEIEDASNVPLIIVGDTKLRKKCCLIVDSGAQLNIIKEDILKPEIRLKETQVKTVSGITDEPINIQGKITLQLGNEDVTFYVTASNLQTICDGILGSPFFARYKASIDYETESIRWKTGEIPFLQQIITASTRPRRETATTYTNNSTREGKILKRDTTNINTTDKRAFNTIFTDTQIRVPVVKIESASSNKEYDYFENYLENLKINTVNINKNYINEGNNWCDDREGKLRVLDNHSSEDRNKKANNYNELVVTDGEQSANLNRALLINYNLTSMYILFFFCLIFQASLLCINGIIKILKVKHLSRILELKNNTIKTSDYNTLIEKEDNRNIYERTNWSRHKKEAKCSENRKRCELTRSSDKKKSSNNEEKYIRVNFISQMNKMKLEQLLEIFSKIFKLTKRKFFIFKSKIKQSGKNKQVE